MINIVALKRKIFGLLAATFSIAFASYSQDTEVIFNQGLDLEKSFQDHAALNKYDDVLRYNATHAPALTHASRMLSNLAGRQTEEATKREFATRARSLALRAIKIDYYNKEARVNYVISLALLAEVASGPKEKIQHARTIKREAELLLSLDPEYVPALYILGKWHLTLSTLSRLERFGCSLMYSDVLENASLTNALRCFDKAIAMEPEYILFHYNRALAQYYSGNMIESRRSINRALTLAQKEPDDAIRIRKCQDLLKQITNAE